MTTRDDRIREKLSLKNRASTSKNITADLRDQHGVDICARAVSRYLAASGLHGRNPRRKPLLAQRQKNSATYGHKNIKIGMLKKGRVIWFNESNIEVSNFKLIFLHISIRIS